MYPGRVDEPRCPTCPSTSACSLCCRCVRRRVLSIAHPCAINTDSKSTFVANLAHGLGRKRLSLGWTLSAFELAPWKQLSHARARPSRHPDWLTRSVVHPRVTLYQNSNNANLNECVRMQISRPSKKTLRAVLVNANTVCCANKRDQSE